MKRFGGTWFTIAGLGLILALALVFLYVGWILSTGEQGAAISTHGYIAMALGGGGDPGPGHRPHVLDLL